MNRTLHQVQRVGMVRHLSDAHWDIVSRLCSGLRDYRRGDVISRREDRLDESVLLLDGLIGRHIPNPDHDAQHLVAVEVPGDFADLHAFPLKRLDHNVTALSDVRVAVFPHRALRDAIEDHPTLARELWALTLVDAAIHRHWAYRTGALRALGNVANLLSELETRLRIAGVVAGPEGFPLLLTQTDIGEACGLSAVHVNRVLRELREAGCVRLSNGWMNVLDRESLHRLGRFDPSYLYLPPN